MLSERERIHAELLDSLYTARKRVAELEGALAHNAALLGIGVERESQLGTPPPEALDAETSLTQDPSSEKSLPTGLEYLAIEKKEDDISEYLGSEGNEKTRPRLGDEAPDSLRPKDNPAGSPLVYQVALAHPDDSISFAGSGATFPAAASDASSDSDLENTAALSGASSVAGSRVAAAIAAKSDVAANATDVIVAYPEFLLPEKRNAAFATLGSAIFPDGSSASRALLAVQATNEGVWDWEVDTGREYQSPRWRAIIGVSPNENASPLESLASRLHPVDAAVLRSRIKSLIAGKLTRLRVSIRIQQHEGEWTWGLLRAVCHNPLNDESPRVVATLADITADREAELALRASEKKFRALAEDSPDFILRFDSSLHFLYASPNAQRYLSEPLESIAGKHFSLCYSGANAQFFAENLQRVFEMGLPAQAETQLNSPVMGEFVAECRFWPEFGTEGEVVSVTAQVRDMTYSHSLAENYHALFNSMADGFALFERSGMKNEGTAESEHGQFVLLAANPALGKMLDLDTVKAIGRRLPELMGKDAAQWETCLEKVLNTNRAALYSLQNSSPQALLEISAYTPEAGRVACIVKDVTEMHMVEQEVRLNEARFAALYRLSHMDAAPEEEVVQFSLDQAVHLTGSSIGYLRMVHGREGDKGKVYWSREVAAQYDESVLLKEIEKAGITFGITAPSQVRKAKIVNRLAHGSLSFGPTLQVHSFMLAPVIEDGRVVCIAGVANKNGRYETSDLRQMELFINGMWFQLRRRWSLQSLQKAKEAAEAANHAKNEFLANVSHELRTPLNGMLGMMQLLHQSSLTPEQLECVTTANYSGRSLLRIISDILDFSRIEAGRFELKPQLFDFAATVRSTLGMFLHQAEEKKLGFSLHLHESIPPLLLGDDARVRQIIFNLVGNAFKFTREGAVTVECSLLPIHPKGKFYIYIAVRDTGIGIPEEKFDLIFRAFTQLDGSSTRRYAGTGLGLSIVQRLVCLMGGSLCVESEVGVGSTMHCSLPFFGAAKRFSTRTVAAPVPQPLRILVAEDDPINQRTVQRLLEKGGHMVVCVNDGRQAIEALMLQEFDCLITDIQMPEMDGVELVGRIRREEVAGIEPSAAVLDILGMTGQSPVLRSIPSELPIIALTAHAMAGDRERFLSFGMDYYLAKPIIAAELSAVLHKVSVVLHNGKGV